MINDTETLEKEAPAKTPKTSKPVKPPKPANLPEPSKNELKKEIEWFDLKSIRAQRSKEEPLHVLVYYKIMHYDSKRPNAKYMQESQRHGRITFSHFLSQKYGQDKKYKFGALDGKIIFQVTDKDGLGSKLASRVYRKNCVSCADVAELIYDKYGLEESSHSAYFKLKDLGNDFYLIDEIIK